MSETACRRWGPGRLPYADRRGVGGSIAIGSMGILVTVLWFGSTWLLLLLGVLGTDGGFMVTMALLFVPITGPVTVLCAGIAWSRYYPPQDHELYGAVFGMGAGMIGLMAGAFGPSLWLFGASLYAGTLSAADAMAYFLIVPISFVSALIVAGWLVFPLLAVSGWYHERVKVR